MRKIILVILGVILTLICICQWVLIFDLKSKETLYANKIPGGFGNGWFTYGQGVIKSAKSAKCYYMDNNMERHDFPVLGKKNLERLIEFLDPMIKDKLNSLPQKREGRAYIYKYTIAFFASDWPGAAVGEKDLERIFEAERGATFLVSIPLSPQITGKSPIEYDLLQRDFRQLMNEICDKEIDYKK